MRKASRLFEIIQILRLARRPMTAARMAASLEVTVRSIYRDIVALQAMGVPVEGERGLGYILRPGFHLPPLMVSIEEAEAIVVALGFIERTGDRELIRAARQANRTIAAALPAPLRQALRADALHAWGPVSPAPAGIALAVIRRSIRDEQKLELVYRDEAGRETRRLVRPIALIYYAEGATIVAWCELREGIRNFRAERIVTGEPVDAHFRGEGDGLRRQWTAAWTDPR
jgi:predicted DNA-binding transcriptional regulator YafY